MKMSDIPTNVRSSISSCISRACSKGAEDGPGSMKRALLVGMVAPQHMMNEGFTVWYGSRKIVSVGLSEQHGRCLVAETLFKTGDYIMAGRGHMHQVGVDHTEDEDRYTWSSTGDYILSQYIELDANPMRFVNSSKDYGVANAKIVWVAGMRVPVLMAITIIAPAEEILVDYPVGMHH